MSSKLLVITALIGAISGCARAPKQMAAEPLPFELPSDWAVASSSLAQEQSGWVSQLADPQLEQYVRSVLAGNANYQALQAKAEVFLLQYKGAQKDIYPSVEMEFAGNRQQVMRGALPGLEASKNAQLSLSVDWEFDLWGRLRASKRAALLQYQSEKEALHYAQLSLAAQGAKVWFERAETLQLLALGEQELKSWQLSKDVLQRRYRGGESSATALHQVDAQLALADAQVKQMRLQSANVERKLSVLAGELPAREATPSQVEFPSIPDFDVQQVPLASIEQRPDVKAAMAALKASDARASAAYYALYPQFRLSLVPALVSGQLTSADSTANTFNSSLAVLQPIFSRGNLKLESKKAQLAAQQEYWRYVQTLLDASESILAKVDGQQSLVGQLAAQESALQAALLAQESAQQDYYSGVADVQAWLQLQREYLALKKSVVKARTAALNNWVDIQLDMANPIFYEDVKNIAASSSAVTPKG